MDPSSNSKPMIQQSRSHLLHSGFSKILSPSTLRHPQKTFTAQLQQQEQQEQQSRQASSMSNKPGEHFEPRQTSTSEDYAPNPKESLPLSPARQRLVDDILALYCCEPTIERVKRYTPDCVYDDQFVYANDRYKMAAQWFALPKLFSASKCNGYQIIKNDKDLIQFKYEQSWTFRIIPKTATLNALVSLALDPATVDSDFIQVKYHKDQANDKDYSHEGLGFTFKKFQADQVPKMMSSKEVETFAADKGAGKEHVRKYGSGAEEGDAPKKSF